MKRLLPIGALILIFSLGANAQQTASVERNPPTASAHQYSIRAGTFMVELTKPLHAAKVQVGEEVIATLEKDLLRNGKVWVAKGSTVTGHVIEVQAYASPDYESRLRVVFDKLVSKSGDEIVFASPAVVLAVAPDKRAIPEIGGSNGQSVREGGNLPGGSNFPDGRTPTNSAAYGSSTRRAYVCDATVDQTSFELAVRGSSDASLGSILTPTARGALCMKGYELKDAPAGLIVNKDKSIVLEYGTQMVITIKSEAK